MSHIKRIFFPFGIFAVSIVLLAGGSAAGIAGYHYVALKSGIADFENRTQQYLVPLLDACVQMGSIDGGKESGGKMSLLFRDYQQRKIVYKAFFVKEDGTVLAHSGSDDVKVLNNNIAADEFTYNLDQIYLPLKKDMKEPLFADYYLIDRKVPLERRQADLVKKYLYPSIDRNGWILARQVRFNDKPFGVVAFLVDKEPVYLMVEKSIKNTVWMGKIGIAAALAFALLFSLIAAIRGRMVYTRALRDCRVRQIPSDEMEISMPDESSVHSDAAVGKDAAAVNEDLSVAYEIDSRIPVEKNILVQDAIPLRKNMN